jgi:PD-(D/E)XK endonuclease
VAQRKRALGLQSANAVALRILRRHAERLELDTSHFRPRRTWTDESLRTAVQSSTTWAGVATALGLVGGGKTIAAIKAHAQRLRLEIGHLSAPTLVQGDAVQYVAPDLSNLRTAAASIAMAWFLLRGCKASLPVEPCAYDVVADIGGQMKRVQVKTVTRRARGGWEAPVARSARADRAYRVTYGIDEVDLFFIVDGEMTLYLIPIAAVAGKTVISLSAYTPYRVGTARNFLEANGMWPSSDEGA